MHTHTRARARARLILLISDQKWLLSIGRREEAALQLEEQLSRLLLSSSLHPQNLHFSWRNSSQGCYFHRSYIPRTCTAAGGTVLKAVTFIELTPPEPALQLEEQFSRLLLSSSLHPQFLDVPVALPRLLRKAYRSHTQLCSPYSFEWWMTFTCTHACSSRMKNLAQIKQELLLFCGGYSTFVGPWPLSYTQSVGLFGGGSACRKAATYTE
jgi:hypothetical protein